MLMSADTVAVIAACRIIYESVPSLSYSFPSVSLRTGPITPQCVIKTGTVVLLELFFQNINKDSDPHSPSLLGAINISSAICWNQHLQLLSWAVEAKQSSSGRTWKTSLPPGCSLSSARQVYSLLIWIKWSHWDQIPQYLKNLPLCIFAFIW